MKIHSSRMGHSKQKKLTILEWPGNKRAFPSKSAKKKQECWLVIIPKKTVEFKKETLLNKHAAQTARCTRKVCKWTARTERRANQWISRWCAVGNCAVGKLPTVAFFKCCDLHPTDDLRRPVRGRYGDFLCDFLRILRWVDALLAGGCLTLLLPLVRVLLIHVLLAVLMSTHRACLWPITELPLLSTVQYLSMGFS